MQRKKAVSSGLPEAGNSIVTPYVLESDDRGRVDFSGITLTWLAENAIIANTSKYRLTSTSKSDPYIWITSFYVFRGPFNSLRSKLPPTHLLHETVTTTDLLLERGCTTLLRPIGNVTDKEKNMFLIYDSPYKDTDYTKVKEQKLRFGELTLPVRISTGTDVLPLSIALAELAGDLDINGPLIRRLQKQGQYILQDIINMYILGMTNIGMHYIFVNLKTAIFFIIGPQFQKKPYNGPEAGNILVDAESSDKFFYFGGGFSKKALPVW